MNILTNNVSFYTNLMLNQSVSIGMYIGYIFYFALLVFIYIVLPIMIIKKIKSKKKKRAQLALEEQKRKQEQEALALKKEQEIQSKKQQDLDNKNYISSAAKDFFDWWQAFTSQNDSSSVFISREEVYKLIQEKYFYASIVFKYKFYVDKNTVLKVFVNKEN